MAAKVTQAAMKAKVGDRLDGHLKANANAKTNYGRINLPGGISNGIAVLEECYFAEHENDGPTHKKGQLYFRAMGSVVSPEEVNGVPVAGLQTSMIIACYAKGDVTEEEAFFGENGVTNEMRKLGGETFTRGVKTVSDLPGLAEALEKSHPAFRFSTQESKEVKNPDGSVKFASRVWERWHGGKGLENYKPPVKAKMDATKLAPSTNGHATAATLTANPGIATPLTANRTTAVTTVTPPNDQGPGTTVDALCARAKAGDSDAMEELQNLCTEAGIQDDQYAKLDWDEIARYLHEDANATTGDDAAAKPTEPNPGDIVGYCPLIGKAKKPGAKVSCEVQSVDKVQETVTLKNVSDKKGQVYKDVSWNDLLPTDG